MWRCWVNRPRHIPGHHDMLGDRLWRPVLVFRQAAERPNLGTDLVARLESTEFAIVVRRWPTDGRGSLLYRNERALLSAKFRSRVVERQQPRQGHQSGPPSIPRTARFCDETAFVNRTLRLGRAKASRLGQHVLFERAIRD